MTIQDIKTGGVLVNVEVKNSLVMTQKLMFLEENKNDQTKILIFSHNFNLFYQNDITQNTDKFFVKLKETKLTFTILIILILHDKIIEFMLTLI